MIKKVYFRGRTIYMRDVIKFDDSGFYQVDDNLIANGAIIDEWWEWLALIQSEIKARIREKTINKILQE
jgi:hypothetical protein